MRHRIFFALAATTMLASAGALHAQETAPEQSSYTTTPDGKTCDGVLDTARQCIARDLTKNTLDRPYRPAGHSDGRLAGPNSGFGRRDRRLVYSTTPGGHAGGQYPGSTNGIGIIVLDAEKN